jgi:acetyl/propionyl-CoA carboxylase alpha subunit
VKPKGHAIECRINAEHPFSFIPSGGIIRSFVPPKDANNVRIDTALSSGSIIPPFYDSLIAKVICFQDSRIGAIETMKRSLSMFRISGIPTTIPFHISALNDMRFVEGMYDTSFVDELKPFSLKDGEVASAILFQLPRKVKFLQKEGNSITDTWTKSGYIDSNFDKYLSISRWLHES